MKGNCFPFILILLIILGCIFVKKEDQIREAFGGFKEGFREGQGTGWTKCADEGGTCSTIGDPTLTGEVRYGKGNCWSVARKLQGNAGRPGRIGCNNTNFSDWRGSRRGVGFPAWSAKRELAGTRKECQWRTPRRGSRATCAATVASGAAPSPPPPPPPPAATGATCIQRDMVRVNGQWRNCCVRCGTGYSALSTIGDGGRCLTCGIAPPPPPPRLCNSYSCPCGFQNTGTQQCANNNCTQTQCCSKIPKEEIAHCISQLSWGRNCAKCDPEGWELSNVPKNAPRPPPPPPAPQPACGSQVVPSPPPPDCFKQVAPDCKKIPLVPIDNCLRQRDWGKSCITCAVGYKISSDKTRCDLIPIPFCKTQEREVCLECQEAYSPSKSARKCNRIPKVKIPNCTNQRDWGAYCYECGADQSGYMVSEDKTKCIPRPISNCKDQEGLRCNKCRFAYSKSPDWKSCDIVAIKDCAIQNKSICAECKLGYKMGENRRKCDLLPISNCRQRYEAFRPLEGFGKDRIFSNAS